MHWTEDFLVADAAPPVTKISFRKRIPAGVQSRWNLLFILWIYIINYIRKPNYNLEFLKFFLYAMLIGYISLIHFTWIMVLTFSVVILFPPSVNLFWGNEESKPIMPIIWYALFILIVCLTVILNILLNILSTRNKGNVEIVSNDQPTLSTNKEIRGLDFTTIEVVPMVQLDNKQNDDQEELFSNLMDFALENMNKKR